MAFFWGRFDPIEADAEVKDLYRIRDNDEQYKNHPGQLVDLQKVYPFSIDGWKNSGMRFASTPSDAIWLSMSNEERIENGLPTTFRIFADSSFGIILAAFWGGK